MVARRHFIHLVTGSVEQQSLLLRQIASASPFQAEAGSNFTQVQRIIRDSRLTRESTYYPFLSRILAALPCDQASITLDQTAHTDLSNVVLLGWAFDGVSLPLGFALYPTDGAWAGHARSLLARLDALFPEHHTITLLADRIYAGSPFLDCLDELEWGSVIWLPEDTFIESERDGWSEVRNLRRRANRLRVFENVRIWKGSTRRSTVCSYRIRATDGTVATWYIVTNLAGKHTRFVEYACRWWQECTHKLLKSGMFNWEAGRVVEPGRVTILLMAAGCACWALWLLGRSCERTSKRKPTTTKNQKRRQNIIKRGWDVR